MPERGDVHVVPHEGNWRVEVEGMPLLPATYGTQADARDAGRESSPMRAAPDADLLETSDLDIEAAFEAAVGLIKRKIGR